VSGQEDEKAGDHRSKASSVLEYGQAGSDEKEGLQDAYGDAKPIRLRKAIHGNGADPRPAGI
jgi:hypothetical protein